MHAQPLQIPDDSADDSDPDDNADDATNDNDTTSATVPTAESVAVSSDTSDRCEVCCFKNVKMWLWFRAGILDSVAVAQTLSLGPWLPDMSYTHSHGAAPVLLNVH